MDDNIPNELTAQAIEFVKLHRKEIVRDALNGFTPNTTPISAFMAGSPGAGKTETSKRLLQNTENVLRIDADELRDLFKPCGYTGTNSHLFQRPASRLVHEIHDAALKSDIGFLLDGTFASINIARQNIERSLKRNRMVVIIFVYQSPSEAWNFVQKRERAEGRRVRAEDFASKFYAAQVVVNKIKAEFGDRVTLALVQKNLTGGDRFYQRSVDRIDDHIAERYTDEQILDAIASVG